MKNALLKLEDLPLVNCSLVKEFIIVLFTTVKVIEDFSREAHNPTIKELLRKTLGTTIKQIGRLGPTDI